MEIAEVKERDDRKDKLLALRNVPKKKLLEETANTQLVFTKTNELFYAAAVVGTNRFGMKIDKVAGRKEPMVEEKVAISIRVKRLSVVIEELKQRITAIAAKVRRYQGQVDSSRQNRLFENNQRQSYRELDQEEKRCSFQLFLQIVFVLQWVIVAVQP